MQGMSYWTYTDLFEEPGPPPTPFHGGFGLLTREGIRKPAYFAYKYLHALQGNAIAANDAQAMVATNGKSVSALIWDFEQPVQKVSNHPFYSKVVPSQAAAPVQLKLQHLVAGAAYRLQVHRTGYQANDAYSAYIEMGAPKNLDPAQLAKLNALTTDQPEEDKTVQAGKNGALEVTVAMRSNDIVLVTLEPAAKTGK